MFWAADGQDENELRLQTKMKKVYRLMSGKLAKTQTVVDSLYKNSLDFYF